MFECLGKAESVWTSSPLALTRNWPDTIMEVLAVGVPFLVRGDFVEDTVDNMGNAHNPLPTIASTQSDRQDGPYRELRRRVRNLAIRGMVAGSDGNNV